MAADRPRFVPYPPIESLGVIGDRHSAALISADGTINWLCLPNYDGSPIFGALLDAERGGYWRMGPRAVLMGTQRYHDGPILDTTWSADDWTLELTDAMAAPDDDWLSHPNERRLLLRRLRCTRGAVECDLALMPQDDFEPLIGESNLTNGVTFSLASRSVFVWLSRQTGAASESSARTLDLRSGDEVWAILDTAPGADDWSAEAARALLDRSIAYWRQWIDGLAYRGPRRSGVLRSATLVHLLGYAPAGSLVAAPTSSLPERIGGARNYDYRFAWVRDASLSLAVLAMLGQSQDARAYMDWLVALGSSTDAPLQVLYGIDGRTELTQSERLDLAGFRHSRPVRTGNHAFSQLQLDSLGYLADCMLIYLEYGGAWRDEYWSLVRRSADYVAESWRQPNHGIWEMDAKAHYVSGKVMSWVCLDRAVKLAEKLDRDREANRWRAMMLRIHDDVMQRGWSEALGAFRQRYEIDALDSAALLIPVMGFLPADHPRVQATVRQIETNLTIDGFVHRYVPNQIPDHPDVPVGDLEGAFLPCTVWLATTYAKQGRPDAAEELLDRLDQLAEPLGLFAEEIDARSGAFVGNHPLLFSQVEYVRAVIETARARPLDAARLMLGQVERVVEQALE